MTEPLRAAESAAPMMLSRLEHLIRSSRTYPDGHRALQNAIHAIGEQLEALTGGHGEMPVHIVGDRILVGSRLLRCPTGARSSIRELAAFFAARGLGGVRVYPGVRDEMVQTFVRVLLEFPGDGGPGPGPINRELQVRKVDRLQVEAPRAVEQAEKVESQHDPALISIRVYLRALRLAAELAEHNIRPALRVELNHCAHALTELYLEAPRRALAVARPKELAARHLSHPVHTAIYAVAAGHALGFDIASLEELAQCALAMAAAMEPIRDEEEDLRGRPPRVADLASTAPPIDVNGGLQHVQGIRRLLADNDLSPLARRLMRTVFEHDLGMDHQGPPAVLRWPSLHVYTQVVCAAAEFERLLAGGDTGRQRKPDKAIAELREEEGRYHPEAVAGLERLLPELEIVSAYL